MKGTEGGVEAFSGSLEEGKRQNKHESWIDPSCRQLLGTRSAAGSTSRRTLSASVSLAAVTGVTLDEAVLRGGRGEVKSNVGKGKVLLGSEIRGRSGTSATYRQKAAVGELSQLRSPTKTKRKEKQRA